MDEVVPGLWVSGVRAAMDVDYLSRAGVTHIITCMKQNIPVPRPLTDGRTITREHMKHVRIDDEEKAPILVHFADCNELIAEQLKEEWVPDTPDISTTTGDEMAEKEQVDQVQHLVAGRQKRGGQWGTWQTTGAGTVLVHCQAGCSRSIAIVAAYLMHTRRISAATAVSMLQKRRKDAEPNKGFMAQLELYEQVGYEIDMKWQAVRRFLMSKTDILNGDSIDDMLLSYYPSPYPSLALGASGLKGFTAIKPLPPAHNASASTEVGDDGGLSVEDQPTANTKSRRNSTSNPKTRSRSASCSNSSNTCPTSAPRISLLSSIAPSPTMANSTHNSVGNLDRQFSTMTTPSTDAGPSTGSSSANTEVKVTANSSGRLPGGVRNIRGHEGVNNRGALPKPQFTGPKLRCKGCRRELAALDHVVIHEPGKGQMAFDHSRRDTGHAELNKISDNREGAQQDGAAALSVESAANGEAAVATTTDQSTETDASQPKPPGIQTAASLASQLPPHLAALRRGGNRPQSPPLATSTFPHAPHTSPPPTTRSMSSMLKSPACSSYFIEPMAWMSHLSSGQVTGRLNCPSAKCGAKLGSWDWAGMQCACGSWVTPAFALHRSKVDEI